VNGPGVLQLPLVLFYAVGTDAGRHRRHIGSVHDSSVIIVLNRDVPDSDY